MNLESLLILLVITNKFFCSCVQIFPSNYNKKIQDNVAKVLSIANTPRPSPINLVRSSMITKRRLKPFYFSPEHSISQELKRVVQPDGLEVTFDFDAETPSFTGNLLKFEYEFEKLFFRWDNNSTNEHGSYHTVEGKYFPLELQAYYKIIPSTSIFGGFFPEFLQNRIQQTVIISQFFKINSKDNPAIQAILNGSRTSIDKLLPQLQEYATYQGSFVVPPFTEDVKWIISLNPQKISKTQMDEFRKLNITGISRAIQPLYGRKVFYIIPWQN